MNRKKRILQHYEPRIDTGRDNYDILDWASAASQAARFAALVDNVDLDGKSLLDVGCGLADLLTFLDERGISVDYTGLDLSERMLAAARQRHGRGRFVCADIFSPRTQDDGPLKGQSFDIVFCSGTFNLNLDNNPLFLPQAVSRLRPLARKYLVFNLLHHRAQGSDRNYAYYDPAKVLAGVAAAGWRCRVIEDYLPNDFTVICRRTS